MARRSPRTAAGFLGDQPLDTHAEAADAAVSGPLAQAELAAIDAYWRAANYLSVGQIYLLANPLLREPLTLEHIKPRLLGHWGTTPGLNFIYVHLNRVIKTRDLDMIYVTGPGHGGAGDRREHLSRRQLQRDLSERVAQTATAWSGCSGSSRFPAASRATPRPKRRVRSTRAANSAIRLLHAYGAVFDNPDLIAACVIGDGEAETGALAASLAFEQVSQSRRATARCCRSCI